MKPIWETVGRFFGPSHNDRFSRLLLDLAETAIACGAHFRSTLGKDLQGIIDFEHKGDAIVDEIHELLDNAFIMRFDIPEVMRLTDDLDNVIDGMRKAAIHIDIYKQQLAALRPDALELFAMGEEMLAGVRDLVAMLSAPRLTLAKVREVANAVDEGESRADKLVSQAERKLVAEYSPPGANRLEFIAWSKLYELLEQITDDANHCAKLILSLARKEA
jgi:uncharacterized protein Yka (UPF0111/DUF47 family)